MEKAAVAGVVAARARVGEVGGGNGGENGGVTAVCSPRSLNFEDRKERHQSTAADPELRVIAFMPEPGATRGAIRKINPSREVVRMCLCQT